MTNRKFSRMAQICAGFTVGLGFSAALGWVLDALFLAQAGPAFVPMAQSTLLSFIALGTATFARARWPQSRCVRRWNWITGVGVLVVSGYLFVQAAGDFGVDLEKILFGVYGTLHGIPLGRMSIATASLFIFSSLSVLVSLAAAGRSRFGVPAADVLAGGVFTAGLTFALAYSYGTPLLYGGTIVPPALTTALAFAFLGLALVALDGRDGWPMRALAGNSMRAVLLRTFLPFITSILLLEGWVDAQHWTFLQINPALLAAIWVVVFAAIVGTVIAVLARHRGDALDRAQQALRESEERFRQAQKLEAVGLLAGGVAHDFNNLLTVIIGYSQLLLRHLNPDAANRSEVKEILQAAERGSALVRQLLAFSRKQMLRPEALNLNTVIKGFEKMLRRLLGEDVELQMRLDATLETVSADEGQMQQILMNLAVNARDAMPDGGSLAIETANVELTEPDSHFQTVVKPGSYVRVSVSDTGAGMDDATQARVFEPFFTTKGPGKGTGLGLATVYGIVKQSGGYIWVYSEVGVGTTFRIYLPRIDHETAQPSGREEQRPSQSTGSETVLLVEDDAVLRCLVRRSLEESGYTVLEAEGGRGALQLTEGGRRAIHLLVTDVIMPEMNGRELANTLTAVYPGMKVLFMSGYSEGIIDRHGVLDAGIWFLEKPFDPVALAMKVRAVLDSNA